MAVFSWFARTQRKQPHSTLCSKTKIWMMIHPPFVLNLVDQEIAGFFKAFAALQNGAVDRRLEWLNMICGQGIGDIRQLG